MPTVKEFPKPLGRGRDYSYQHMTDQNADNKLVSQEDRQLAYQKRISVVLRRYLETEKAMRANPISYRACDPNPPDLEYERQREEYRQATRDLWEVTDGEYSEDGFRDKMWNWRYWSVMARKCTHHLLRLNDGEWAGVTMAKLHKAEYEFAVACGLGDLYESPCKSLEKMFPNLRSSSQAPEISTITTHGSWWTAVKNWLGITGR
jgi:hypothetical protein